MTALLGHIALLMGSASGATCPDYSTVTLRVESPTYTPPTTDAVLTVLNCPYTPPTVV